MKTPNAAYRVAEVDAILEQTSDGDRGEIRAERRRLEALLVPQPEGRGVDPKMPPSMPDEDLVNALAQYLELEVVEKQALLERDGLLARCRSLIELLEMKVIVSRHNWGGGQALNPITNPLIFESLNHCADSTIQRLAISD